jgi:hypothetical protein
LRPRLRTLAKLHPIRMQRAAVIQMSQSRHQGEVIGLTCLVDSKAIMDPA